MFDFFRKKRIAKYEAQADLYVNRVFVENTPPLSSIHTDDNSQIKYSLREAHSSDAKFSLKDKPENLSQSEIRYSDRESSSSSDLYNSATVARVLRNYSRDDEISYKLGQKIIGR